MGTRRAADHHRVDEGAEVKRLLILIVLLFAGCGTPIRECVKAHNEVHPWVEYSFYGLWNYSTWENVRVCDEWKAR